MSSPQTVLDNRGHAIQIDSFSKQYLNYNSFGSPTTIQANDPKTGEIWTQTLTYNGSGQVVEQSRWVYGGFAGVFFQ